MLYICDYLRIKYFIRHIYNVFKHHGRLFFLDTVSLRL